MPPTVITIGNFDGVHLGHRAILHAAKRLAQGLRASVLAYTFDPHPASVLKPSAQPPALSRLEDRIELLRASGADEVRVLTPTRDLLGLSPEEFIRRLTEEHAMAAMVEGDDFRFGAERRGDVGTLRELGRAMGFEVHCVPAVEAVLSDLWALRVSSSAVRWLLSRGRVADAARCLGRSYSLSSTVVTGDRRGRTLGFPTLNLDPQPLHSLLTPAPGVYAGAAQLDSGASHPAAISIGVKPTFDGGALAIEAHLPGFSGDLYGKAVRLSFERWLRDQQRFPSPEALRAQLARDAAQALLSSAAAG